MKRLLSIFFLIIYLAASLSQLTLTLVFYANQKQLTETFCVNKNKPEVLCSGKCHLAKTIAKTEHHQKDKGSSSNIEINVFAPVFFINEEIQLPKFENCLLKEYTLYSDILIAKFQTNIFHPPQV